MTDLPLEPTQAVPQPDARTVAGRYRLLDLVGRGGTAEVWRARDDALGRTVALKLVTVPTDEGAQRAGEEARLLARLNHPSLVPVYDAGTEDDRPWVVMELVEGETLADTVRRGPLDPARTGEVGQAVASALAYVHAQGLVHRDVKPANVLMGRDGRVRLTDFGIARLVDAAKVTATGLTVGTASYLAPEQVLGERVTPMADVYALGLVLLECLTGRREYAGSTVEAAIARLNRQPEVPATLPPGWVALLTAMTARSPDDRPTASEAAGRLAEVVAGTGATTVLAPPPSDRTSVLPQTQAAPAAPAPQTRVAPRPAGPPTPPAAAYPRVTPRPAPRTVPAARVPRNDWRWAIALVAVVALLAAGAAVSGLFTRDTGSPIPALKSNVPPAVRGPLERLQQEVRK